MAKVHVAVVLAILLVGLIAAFVGLGFGTGALSVASPPTYSSTPFNLDSAIEWQVNLTSVTMAGDTPTTAISSSGHSSVVTFTMTMWAPSRTQLPPCNGAENPVWDPGVGADWGAMEVSMGSGTPFTLITGGVQEVAPTGHYFYSLNSSGLVAWCVNGAVGNGGGAVSPSLGPGAGVAFTTSFTLVGVYQPQTLTVALIGHGSNCAFQDIGSNSGTACQAIGADPNCNSCGPSWSPDGSGWAIDAYASITTRSAYAYMQVTNPGQLTYDGQTLTAQATTGYGGPAGYSANVLYPSARPDGGQVDPEFATVTVPNDCLSPCQFSWAVPQDAGQNHSGGGAWNDFTVVLTSGNGYVTGQAVAAIDVSPLYAPPAPAVSFHNTGKFTGPQVGDSLTITVTVTSTTSSGPVTAVNLWVYYNPDSNPPGAQPPCGNDWVTACGGTTLPVPSGGQATYTFSVDPPAGVTQVDVQAQASNDESQVSPIATASDNIVPSNCVGGVAGCPTLAFNLWALIGPILLSAIIVVAALLATTSLPGIGWGRYLVVIVTVGGVVVAYLFLFPAWFQPGGLLNLGR